MLYISEIQQIILNDFFYKVLFINECQWIKSSKTLCKF